MSIVVHLIKMELDAIAFYGLVSSAVVSVSEANQARCNAMLNHSMCFSRCL